MNNVSRQTSLRLHLLNTGKIVSVAPRIRSAYSDFCRGSIVGLHAQFIGLGYATSNWVGFGVYFAEGQFTVSVLDHSHSSQ